MYCYHRHRHDRRHHHRRCHYYIISTALWVGRTRRQKIGKLVGQITAALEGDNLIFYAENVN